MAAVQDGLWEWDTRTGIIEMDKRCHQMLGYEVLSQKLNFQTWQRAGAPWMIATGCSPRCNARLPWASPSTWKHACSPQGTWRWMETEGKLRRTTQKLPGWSSAPRPTSPPQAGNTPSASTARQCRRSPVYSTPERTHCGPTRAVETFSKTACPARRKSHQRFAPARSGFTHFLQYVDVVREQGSVEVEYPSRAPPPAPALVSIRGTPLTRSSQGRRDLTLVDTTERRETEEVLATAQAHLMEVIQHFPGGCWYKTRMAPPWC